ncbi:MAG: hypothetical protein AAB470_00410 [Patescibacteria group bacterium]
MINPSKKQPLGTQNSVSNQTALQHGQFLSRIFTDQSGQQFCLIFFVTIVVGEAHGHLVSAQPMKREGQTFTSLRLSGSCASSNSSSGQIFCLPIACPKREVETIYIPAYTPIISPFTELYFFMSQPTRAPSGI